MSVQKRRDFSKTVGLSLVGVLFSGLFARVFKFDKNINSKKIKVNIHPSAVSRGKLDRN